MDRFGNLQLNARDQDIALAPGAAIDVGPARGVYGRRFSDAGVCPTSSDVSVTIASADSTSSFFPLFSVKTIDLMSFEWAMSMFAFLSLAVAVVPFVLYRYGETMLQSSRYLDKMPRRE